MSLCYKQNLVFQLRAVRPSWFSYDFLPILLIVSKYSIVESIRPMRHIYINSMAQ